MTPPPRRVYSVGMTRTESAGGAADQRRLSDNPRLSPERPYRETAEVVEGTVRIMRAVGKRIAREDPDDLRFPRDLEGEQAGGSEALAAGGA